MSKKLAVLQSNYIPWKGYFDLIHAVDEFILYDDVQYTKNDWRNRNKIKTDRGVQWLTIPVRQESLAQTIRDTRVASNEWRARHWKTLAQNYSRCPYFPLYAPVFESLYAEGREEWLSQINRAFIVAINQALGISTRIGSSSDYRLVGDRSERLVNLCMQAGAQIYVTGPAALAYLDCGLFAASGIEVSVADYSGYPEYSQLHPPFEHAVSVVDLLFNCGPESFRYLKTFAGSLSTEPFLVAPV